MLLTAAFAITTSKDDERPEVPRGLLRARRLLAACYDIEVTDDLARITAPTTVIHREGDRAVPIAEGRRLAAGIDGASLTVLSGRTHIPFVGDARSVLNAMRRALGLLPLDRLTRSTVTRANSRWRR